MSHRTLLALSLVGVTAPSLAENQESRRDRIAAYDLLRTGHDLSAIEHLRQLATPRNGRAADEAAKRALAQYGPRLTGLPVPDPTLQGAPASSQDAADAKSAQLHAAVPAIVDLARKHRIVILNEAHDDPSDRAFALEVLKALRPLGFSKLAVEAFNNDEDPKYTDMAALARRGYPIRNTGGYIGDPVFGDMIRKALVLGYKPIAYEQTMKQISEANGDAIDAREEAQASNLANQIIGNSNERMVIYVGYHHAAKFPLRDGEKTHRWMAARLWEKTGVEPLSIDQTGLGATTPLRAEAELRDQVRGRGIIEPVVMTANGKPLVFGEFRGTVDLQVVKPEVVVVHGRPQWLKQMGRVAVKPNKRFFPKHGKALIQAFIKGEEGDAVPIDEIVVQRGMNTYFMLPRAPVRFITKELLP